jgi:hypothetical protein
MQMILMLLACSFLGRSQLHGLAQLEVAGYRIKKCGIYAVDTGG